MSPNALHSGCGDAVEFGSSYFEALMSTSAPQIHRAEDLLRMPDGDRYELVDGELVEVSMGGKSSWIGGQAYRRLSDYVTAHGGWSFPADAGFQCFSWDVERVRKPNSSYVAAGRFVNDEIPEGHIRIAPDLAVEVISPNDIYQDVEAKAEEYLHAGVRLVWVLNPNNRTVRIFSAENRLSTQLGPEDDLTGGDVLPGFSCRVAELFPPQA